MVACGLVVILAGGFSCSMVDVSKKGVGTNHDHFQPPQAIYQSLNLYVAN